MNDTQQQQQQQLEEQPMQKLPEMSENEKEEHAGQIHVVSKECTRHSPG